MLPLIVLVSVGLISGGVRGQTEQEAAIWANVYNQQAELIWYEAVEADWNYNTDLTDENGDRALETATVSAAFDKASALTARTYAWQNFTDQLLKRQFSKIVDIGPAILPDGEYREMRALNDDMTRTYSTARVCNKPGDTTSNCYPLDPDLSQILASPATNWETLVWAWKGWRDESGKKMLNDYETFVTYLNRAADMNGYADNGAYWRSWYESDTFRQDIEKLWEALKPLYAQLHSYVGRKLREKFPAESNLFPTEGHIPAHILGNMWAQSWDNLEYLVRPYPDKEGLDVTNEMIAQGYNARRMFDVSEEFFTSLGLIPMPQAFWDKTMFVKPSDREVVCHASAWDFYNRRDFRIKQCTEVTMDWLMTTHHEMGHIEYFLQYAKHPVSFRDGANPGFHEAAGDTLSLSVSTPEHLIKIGLLKDFTDDDEVDLNYLMNQALQKIAFLPFGYLIDQWRWDVFAGVTPKNKYNEHWWELRCKYQGVSPPVQRTSLDFDPGAKYHIPGNTPYIRYFVSFVIQFQFYKALCDTSGHQGPLHRCDFYQSTEAGKKFGDMLAAGSTIPWPEALELVTGTKEMSVEPLMEYFRPLKEWLEKENEGHRVGWDEGCPPDTVIP